MFHYSRTILFLIAANLAVSSVYAATAPSAASQSTANAPAVTNIASNNPQANNNPQQPGPDESKPIDAYYPPAQAVANPTQQQVSQMSSSQFQAWLQNNGYPQNQPQAQASGTGNTAPRSGGISWNKKRVLSYEEGQKTILSSVPQSSQPPNPDAETAFNNVLQQNIPMTPQQVVRLRQQIDLEQRAASMPPNIPPRPVSSTLMINLAPGTTPPAIRLAQGYVSSLVFVDSTGAPWPISSYDIGNPRAMNIQWDGKSNILLLQAVSPYSDGDIVVSLQNLPTPITLELVSGQRVVDYRADIHVSGIGPNTKEMPLGTSLPDSANQILLGVLDGVAPAGSRQLQVSGADCQAWLLGDQIYFRTQLTVLSPGWMGKMTSPDGMQAYQLPKTSSILVSKYGEPVALKVEGL